MFCKVSLVVYSVGLSLISLVVLLLICFGGFDLLGTVFMSAANKANVEIKEVIGSIMMPLLGGVLLYTAYQFFTDIVEQETPFTETQIKRLRFLGRVILLFGILDVVSALAIYILKMRDYYDYLVYHPSDLPPVFTANAYLFLAGLACYGAAMVFRYGMLLQQLSDDTL
jgi:uncharacterized protein YggT (Ycf19 family)